MARHWRCSCGWRRRGARGSTRRWRCRSMCATRLRQTTAEREAIRAAAAAGGGSGLMHTDGFTLVPMTVAHLDAVMGIEVRAYPFPWSRGNFVDSIASDYLAQCLVAPDGELLAYQVAMAGFEEWHLLNVAVSPEHQGRGLARWLLNHLVDHARGMGAEWLWLEVRPSNTRARQLYARFGFEAVGVRPGYYPAAGGQREDARVLRYPLREAA